MNDSGSSSSSVTLSQVAAVVVRLFAVWFAMNFILAVLPFAAQASPLEIVSNVVPPLIGAAVLWFAAPPLGRLVAAGGAERTAVAGVDNAGLTRSAVAVAGVVFIAYGLVALLGSLSAIGWNAATGSPREWVGDTSFGPTMLEIHGRNLTTAAIWIAVGAVMTLGARSIAALLARARRVGLETPERADS